MKKVLVVVVVLVMALMSVGIVGAQEPEETETNVRPHRRGSEILQLVADSLEIEVEALREALQEEGATLTTVIEANGGDAAAIQEQVVTTIVEKTGRDAALVEEHVTEMFTNPLPPRGERPEGQGPRPGFGPRGEQPPAEVPAEEGTAS